MSIRTLAINALTETPQTPEQISQAIGGRVGVFGTEQMLVEMVRVGEAVKVGKNGYVIQPSLLAQRAPQPSRAAQPGSAPKRATARRKKAAPTARRFIARKKGSAAGQPTRAAQPETPEQPAQRAKKFTVKRGAGVAAKPYPIEVCSVRFKDSNTGKWVSPPADMPKPGKLRRGRSVGDALILTRTVDTDGQITGARVIASGARAAQRRGKLKKSAVRETEKELSRDYLEAVNPALSEQLHRERMHEAHNSSKATRGAATKKKNAAAGVGRKKLNADILRTQLLRTEELVKDAQRLQRTARTYKGKDRAKQLAAARSARLDKLRRDLAAATR